jgi:hypothetical protein
MIFRFKASCCPLAIVRSVGRKVPFVAERPRRPKAKFIAREQVPNSEVAAVRAKVRREAEEVVVARGRERRKVLACVLEVG